MGKLVTFTVEINDAEEKALLTDMVSIQEWIDNAIQNKARRTIDSIVEKKTDKQPKKMTVADKHNLIRGLELETVVEKDARLEEEELERRREAQANALKESEDGRR